MEKKLKKVSVPKVELKELKMHLLLFTLEGHKTWRANFFPTKSDLELYLKKQPGHPTILQKKWFVIDKINGTITEEK